LAVAQEPDEIIQRGGVSRRRKCTKARGDGEFLSGDNGSWMGNCTDCDKVFRNVSRHQRHWLPNNILVDGEIVTF
jgi:hypothetical protein